MHDVRQILISKELYRIGKLPLCPQLLWYSLALWNLLAVQWSGWTGPPFCMVCGARNQGQVGVLIKL
jgi:hypothetical protein